MMCAAEYAFSRASVNSEMFETVVQVIYYVKLLVQQLMLIIPR